MKNVQKARKKLCGESGRSRTSAVLPLHDELQQGKYRNPWFRDKSEHMLGSKSRSERTRNLADSHKILNFHRSHTWLQPCRTTKVNSDGKLPHQPRNAGGKAKIQNWTNNCRWSTLEQKIIEKIFFVGVEKKTDASFRCGIL